MAFTRKPHAFTFGSGSEEAVSREGGLGNVSLIATAKRRQNKSVSAAHEMKASIESCSLHFDRIAFSARLRLSQPSPFNGPRIPALLILACMQLPPILVSPTAWKCRVLPVNGLDPPVGPDPFAGHPKYATKSRIFEP
jgi:hypothetical protein